MNIAPSTSSLATPRPDAPSAFSAQTDSSSTNATVEGTMAHIEQVRLLILGMEQRLQSREEKLVKTIQRAEAEGTRFEQSKQVLSASC